MKEIEWNLKWKNVVREWRIIIKPGVKGERVKIYKYIIKYNKI